MSVVEFISNTKGAAPTISNPLSQNFTRSKQSSRNYEKLVKMIIPIRCFSCGKVGFISYSIR